MFCDELFHFYFQDYLNENNIIDLLREILPKNTKKATKILYKCEWCDDKRKSLVGYANHVKKCAIDQNVIIFNFIIRLNIIYYR